MKNIAVIGTGTAGVVSLAHCLAFFTQDWKVTSVYDPNIPILGIGESTSTQIPTTLFYGADLNFLEDMSELDSTIKHGVKYVNWREQDFFTKIPPPFYAMHFNNFKLKDFAFKRFTEKWGDKFSILEGEIKCLENLPETATIQFTDGSIHNFDYIIDCRGYPEDYTDYEMVDIPVNHAIVNIISEPGNWNYTYHYAHPNGWMFGIPLQSRQGWGYLYNDTITTKNEAIDNIAEIFKTDRDKLNLREFSFKNYKAKKFIDNRIIKNGNRAIFFEPLEALSGWMYDSIIRTFFDVVLAKRHTEESANQHLHNLAYDYELFINYMYHGGSTFDSKFWNITSKKCKEKLKNSNKWQEHVKIMKGLEPAYYTNQTLVFPFPAGVWKNLDQDMKYHYFD